MVKRKAKMGKMLWLVVAGIGNLLILVALVMSVWGISTPNPADVKQNYDCGSVMSPKQSFADSELSTEIVCKDSLAARRGSMLWMQVFGLILSIGGMVMLGKALFGKPKEKKLTEEQ